MYDNEVRKLHEDLEPLEYDHALAASVSYWGLFLLLCDYVVLNPPPEDSIVEVNHCSMTVASLLL